MDQLKGKENLIKSPKYVIHLFGDMCYAASSNLYTKHIACSENLWMHDA